MGSHDAHLIASANIATEDRAGDLPSREGVRWHCLTARCISPTGRAGGWTRCQWAVVALGITQIVAWGTTAVCTRRAGLADCRRDRLEPRQVLPELTIGLFGSGLTSTPIGRWTDRYGGRAVMSLGSVMAAVGLVLLSQARSEWTYLAAWAVLGPAMRMTLYDAAFTALVRAHQAAAGGRSPTSPCSAALPRACSGQSDTFWRRPLAGGEPVSSIPRPEPGAVPAHCTGGAGAAGRDRPCPPPAQSRRYNPTSRAKSWRVVHGRLPWCCSPSPPRRRRSCSAPWRCTCRRCCRRTG